MTSPFLTTREAARYLRLQPTTLERWRSRGSGPRYRKYGGRVVYTREDLEAFANAGLRCSTSEQVPASAGDGAPGCGGSGRDAESGAQRPAREDRSGDA